MTFKLQESLATMLLLFATTFAPLGCKSEPAKPGQAEFDAASLAIGTYSDQVGFGTDAAATEIAKKFAVRLKRVDAENFKGGKDAEKDFVTKGNFLTYCHMQGNNIVFLIQAPNLDTYAGDVRKALYELAWSTAQEIVGKPAGKNLVVALRGKLLYGVIGTGKANAKAPPPPQMGTGLETSPLYAYFQPAGAAPAPAAPAK